MHFRIRIPGPNANFSRALSVDALATVIPASVIEEVLTEHGAMAVRVRKLTMPTVVLVLIARHLYSQVALGAVLRKLARGLRLIWDDPELILPGASALCYRRYQLGARPMAALFHRICQPLTTPATPGAFQFGRRLMALDGTVEEVSDTPANVRAYGRHRSTRGVSALPLVRAVALLECGSHAVIDAGLWPLRIGEPTAAKRLVRSLTKEMLLLWDCNFHSYDLLVAVQQRGAAVLGRLPAAVQPQVVHALPDGSELVTLRPGHHGRRGSRAPLTVRLVTYTLNDPGRAGHGQRHRLITTLLDPTTAPALAVIATYHERWEFETSIDELDTHQRLVGQPFRSRRPVGVVQEFYALLLAHYAVRSLMQAAALQAGLDPDRLSFVAALDLVRDAIPEFQLVAPADLPRLAARLLRDMARAIIPPRRSRTNPRVVKRKISKFLRKRPEHAPWLQPTKPFVDAIVLI
jgi:Insertion element 4 transposase N-terminal/Transposase DDE domain